MDEGFFRSEYGADVGPVLGDIGFDAWSFDASGGGGFYNYQLSSEQQHAVTTEGWEFSVRMRMVTPNSFPGTVFAFGPLWIDIQLGPQPHGDIRIFSNSDLIYTFVGGGGDYHEYSLIYDAVDEIAALWITGIGHVADISSGPVLPDGMASFGAWSGHTHWNEVTLTIVPEPATVALLTGLEMLLLVGGVRWRERQNRLVV